MKPSSRPIRARLVGDRTCTARGLTSCAEAPALELCKLLLKAGHRPDRSLYVYRGRTLALVIGSIGIGAKTEVTGKGTGFRVISSVGRSSPMRKSAPVQAGTYPQVVEAAR